MLGCIRNMRKAFWLLRDIDRKVGTIVTQQEQINAYAARIATATEGIRADIADIKAANPGLDLSALEASVGQLDALDAENPVPTPDPAPEPTPEG